MGGLYARNYTPRIYLLCVESIATRLKWRREQVNWNVLDGGNVLLTDESRFDFQTDKKRLRVYREKCTRNQCQNIAENYAFQGVSTMVWVRVPLLHRIDIANLKMLFFDCLVSGWSPRPHYKMVRFSNWSCFRF